MAANRKGLDLYEKKLSAESVSITMRCGLSPLSSSLDSSEIGDIVETIKLEHTTDIVTDDNGPLNNLTLPSQHQTKSCYKFRVAIIHMSKCTAIIYNST